MSRFVSEYSAFAQMIVVVVVFVICVLFIQRTTRADSRSILRVSVTLTLAHRRSLY